MAAHPLDQELPIAPDGTLQDQSQPPKAGARFSLGPLRILKSWFSRHQDHPYPGSRDLDELQAMTGLSRQQITTWLSNARRRTKSRIPTRPTSPGVPSLSTSSRPLDIPGQSSHASSLDQMDPMERWKHSPPEHEPASTAAILSAVSGSSGFHRPPTPTTQSSLHEDSSVSLSSAGTSLSNHSSAASAYSHLSDSSRRRSDPLNLQHRRPRKRRSRNHTAAAMKRAGVAASRSTLSQAPRRYQCTFCTETFTTKHNWQRHEKSLHLSLERWECSPDGPYVADALGQRNCAFCAEVNPDQEHMRSHNHDACEGRALGERSFYRKDHLFQHLNLVHHVKFDEATMSHWRHDTGDFSSRCGFCGEDLSSWGERADHVAAHFKAGQTMAEWLGDWGFEPSVHERVENAIPPCKNSFLPSALCPLTHTQISSSMSATLHGPSPPSNRRSTPPSAPLNSSSSNSTTSPSTSSTSTSPSLHQPTSNTRAAASSLAPTCSPPPTTSPSQPPLGSATSSCRLATLLAAPASPP